MNNNIKVALIYDFDKTLCDKDMQEYSFIPNLGMDPKDFWKKTDKLAKEQKMDKILAYMYTMLNETERNNKHITKEYLTSLGKDINFFKGVKDWFERINEYGKELGLSIEHYIVSSGLKEIIEGTEIKQYFQKIYGCEFLYNDKGYATWPKMSVNYTNKTQFLSRISKGVLDISDDNTLNKKMLIENKRIKSNNIIYLGDGLTDIPSMKMTRLEGGYAIAVYQNNSKEIAASLLKDGRIDFYAEADYQENKELDKLIKNLLINIAIKNKLTELHNTQLKEIE